MEIEELPYNRHKEVPMKATMNEWSSSLFFAGLTAATFMIAVAANAGI